MDKIGKEAATLSQDLLGDGACEEISNAIEEWGRKCASDARREAFREARTEFQKVIIP